MPNSDFTAWVYEQSGYLDRVTRLSEIIPVSAARRIAVQTIGNDMSDLEFETFLLRKRREANATIREED